MTSNAEIAKAMADNMTHAAVPLYGKKLRLPDRGAIIGIIKEFRRLLFPAYFGDAQLMALPPENYAALLLERIETALTAQVALALPEGQAFAAAALTHEILEQLPRIQQTLMTDIEATFDGDPAAADKEEIIFAYPGLFAIFVYRIAHELYLRQVPMIPRMMTEYAHSRTGIDIHPGAQIGPWFFIDHGTGIVIGETTVIGSHVKLYQGVTLGALSPRAGHASLPGKRHPTVCDYVTIYSGASILGGETVIGEHSVVGGNAFLTGSVADNTRVVITAPETVFKTRSDRAGGKRTAARPSFYAAAAQAPGYLHSFWRGISAYRRVSRGKTPLVRDGRHVL